MENREDLHKLDESLCSSFEKDDIKDLESLYGAILSLRSANEVHRFFQDLCSYNEMCSFLHRWQILLLIHQGKSYEEIIKELAPDKDGQKPADGVRDTRKGKGRSGTKVSSTTISRVKTCYNNPDGGYRTALKKMNNEK